jgi:precorrin-6B methylase 2
MDVIQEDQFIGLKLAPFNPINTDGLKVALEMLAVGEMTADSIFYDLGCGDGRVLVEACKVNKVIRAVGVEYDMSLCTRARAIIEKDGFSSRATVLHDNVLNIDINEASAIFIYLVPDGIKALKDVLLSALERGVRVVTYVFSIQGLKPARVEIYKESTKLYLYTKESL